MLYGLELEMFYYKDGKVTIPPINLPLDGCGAIVELRSSPCSTIFEASGEIHADLLKYNASNVKLGCYGLPEANRHKFTQEEYRLAMKQSNKDNDINIQNIYNKKRRLLPRTTVAVSLQLNISNLLAKEYNDKHGTFHNAQYGLLDVYQIVKKLDKEFHKEILQAKRQPGEYAIKDKVRLEYRSLPAGIFFNNNFEGRVQKVMNSID